MLVPIKKLWTLPLLTILLAACSLPLQNLHWKCCEDRLYRRLERRGSTSWIMKHVGSCRSLEQLVEIVCEATERLQLSPGYRKSGGSADIVSRPVPAQGGPVSHYLEKRKDCEGPLTRVRTHLLTEMSHHAVKMVYIYIIIYIHIYMNTYPTVHLGCFLIYSSLLQIM